jgi:hypothetical protein
MSAAAVQRANEGGQLDLYDRVEPPSDEKRPLHARGRRRVTPLCAGCRAREARYGFRDEELPEPSRTLCFACFQLEIVRRQAHADALARARNAMQLELPMSEKLRQIHLRRRRAQIAARRALGL